MPGILTEILEKATELGIDHLSIKEKAARTWMKKEAEKVKVIGEGNTKSLLTGDTLDLRNNIVPGYLYLFMYDAKGKMDTKALPYWDVFPLIFPIETYDDGFLGINFHYLPHDLRAKLMDALYGLAFSNKYDESVRLRISYEILKSATKFGPYKVCIKRYLYSHIKSKFFYVDWKEWPIILFLPFERFKTQTRFASSRQVWEDSRKKLKG